MRYYSGSLGQRFPAISAGLDVASGIQCKYNCAQTSRLYLASEIRPPPRPEALVIATPCDLEFSRPGMCVRSNLENTFALHI